MKRAIGYTRLSQRSDTSIDRQERNIREYCTERGWHLVDVLDDGEGASGFDTEGREAYQELKNMAPHVGVVITNDKRRLARDEGEVMRLVPLLREHGTALHTVQDGALDIDDTMTAALEILAAAMAAKEKKQEIQKAREAVRERQEQGYWQGGIPHGLRVDDDTKLLERDPDEWEDVETVLEADVVGRVLDDVDVSAGTAYNIAERGREWYEAKLEEHGKVGDDDD